MKLIGNVSDWLSYAGGALIKMVDSAGTTVYTTNNYENNVVLHRERS